MGRFSLQEFVTRTAQQDRGQGLFELENERVLEVNLNGMVWTKAGSMVAYLGNIRFTREGVLEHGVGNFLKKAFLTGEAPSSPRPKAPASCTWPTRARRSSCCN